MYSSLLLHKPDWQPLPRGTNEPFLIKSHFTRNCIFHRLSLSLSVSVSDYRLYCRSPGNVNIVITTPSSTSRCRVINALLPVDQFCSTGRSAEKEWPMELSRAQNFDVQHFIIIALFYYPVTVDGYATPGTLRRPHPRFEQVN